MQYLDVPFSEKELAKQQGARWDPVRKKWYAPPSVEDITLFERWLPVKQDEASVESGGETAAENQKNSVSLSAFLRQVQQCLQQQFVKTVWVRAEIANLSERRGHLYFELSETDQQGQSLANCRAMLWASQADEIVTRFQQITGSPVQNGQKILLLAQVNFHEKFGFSLVIQDIDPTFTLGEIEANLIAIRQKLIAQGLYTQNKQRTLSIDLFNIAVISPPQAAGLGDFRADAENLSKHQLCQFTYFHSAFQGEQVLNEMQGAFHAFHALHQRRPFDALVIIRGGGAKLDLNPLNQFELAKLISETTIPVFTGIGHERDNTILDEVAHTRFDTPSKVIHGIWQRIVNAAKRAQQNWQLIERQSQQTVINTQGQLTYLYQHCQHRQKLILTNEQHHLISLFQQIQHTAVEKINREAGRMDHLMNQVKTQARYPLIQKNREIERIYPLVAQRSARILEHYRQHTRQTLAYILSSGPQSQLKRGFCLVKSIENKPITSVEQAKSETRLTIEFHDGKLAVYPHANQ